jgi:hypothetical protein
MNDSITNLGPPHNLVFAVGGTATTELHRTLREDRENVEGGVLDTVTTTLAGGIPVTQVVEPCLQHSLFVAGGKAEVIDYTLFAMPTNKGRLEGAPKGDNRGNLVDLEVGNVDVNVSRATVGVVNSATGTAELFKQPIDHVPEACSFYRAGQDVLKTAAERAVRLDKPNPVELRVNYSH